MLSVVMNWSSIPAAFEATREMGLRNITFAPLAQPAEGQTYLEALTAAISALSEAASDAAAR